MVEKKIDTNRVQYRIPRHQLSLTLKVQNASEDDWLTIEHDILEIRLHSNAFDKIEHIWNNSGLASVTNHIETVVQATERLNKNWSFEKELLCIVLLMIVCNLHKWTQLSYVCSFWSITYGYGNMSFEIYTRISYSYKSKAIIKHYRLGVQ